MEHQLQSSNGYVQGLEEKLFRIKCKESDGYGN